MKYNIGDTIKTNDKYLIEETIYIQYHNKVGLILAADSRAQPVLYKILLCGTNNRTVWIRENQIEKKL